MVSAIRMIGMISFDPKLSTTFDGKKPTTTLLNDWTWPCTVSVGTAPSSLPRPKPGWNARPSPSASATANALLSNSQKPERRPMLRSLVRLPSEVTDATIATKISGATIASRTPM